MTKRHNKKTRNKKKLSKLVSYGDFILPPIIPRPELVDLCTKIDDFYSNYPKQHKRQASSDLIKGAFYAARPECRSNPDWMSQAAHSLREILYPLISEEVSQTNLIKLAFRYLKDKNHINKIKNKEFINIFQRLDVLYKKFSDIAHHGIELKCFSEKEFKSLSDKSFEDLLYEFILILKKSLSLQQIFIHEIINVILQSKKKNKTIVDDIRYILNFNQASKDYFYYQADERWFDFLWENGFLDDIKKKPEDTSKYKFLTPELNYLVKISEKIPWKIKDFILSIKISRKNFNPEVIDRFIEICAKLPVRELSELAQKIQEEKWVVLMKDSYIYNYFDFEIMMKKLIEGGKNKKAAILLDAILSIKSNEDFEKQKPYSYSIFYLKDLIHSKIFDYITKIEGKEEIEKIIILLIKRLKEALKNTESEFEKHEKIPELKEINDKLGSIFQIKERYLLFKNISELKSVEKIPDPENEIALLVILIKNFSKKLKEQDNEKLKKIFKKHLSDYTFSQLLFRLALYILCLIENGLDNYVEKAKEFIYELKNKGLLEILYSKEIQDFYSKFGSQEEINKIFKKHEYTIDEKHNTNSDNLGNNFILEIEQKIKNLSIENLVDEFKTNLTLEKLRKFGSIYLEPFREILNLLKERIKNEIKDFAQKSELFFDDDLDVLYTYSFIEGIREAIREDKNKIKEIQFDSLFNLFIKILNKLEDIRKNNNKEFEEKRKGDWEISGWRPGFDGVCIAITDLLKELLINENVNKQSNGYLYFEKFRDKIFEILNKLLNYPHPSQKEEMLEDGLIMEYSGKEKKLADPFTIAINSVKGRAFECFVLFVMLDGDNLKEDVKKLYKQIVEKEKTKAINFLIGYYIPVFYYKDRVFFKKEIFNILFSKPKLESEDRYLYYAVLEGHLSQALYKDIFFDERFQSLYDQVLDIKDFSYKNQKHFIDPKIGIARYIAIAFIYFDEFDLNNDLFKKFLEKADIDQKAEFVKFIGEYVFSKNKISKDSVKIKEELKYIWEEFLKNEDKEVLKNFCYWINADISIFDIEWLLEKIKETLEKTEAEVYRSYGLTKSIINLTKQNPQKALEIFKVLAKYLSQDKLQHYIYIDISFSDEWNEALKILLKNEKTKDETLSIINEFILKGGRSFWKFEKLIECEEENNS